LETIVRSASSVVDRMSGLALDDDGGGRAEPAQARTAVVFVTSSTGRYNAGPRSGRPPMRVAMYYANADVRLEALPDPDVGPGEVLIRVRSSGLCGSDVMEWYRKDKVPLVLGHEIAGEIAAVGEGVERLAVGDRVVASHHVPCLACPLCQSGHETACETIRRTTFHPGGFAELVLVPRYNVERGAVYRIPDGVSDDDATFAEPLACVLRGQRRVRMEAARSVLVIGSGISGLLHIALARALGAGRILATDVEPWRLEQAARFGAEATFAANEADLPARIREANGGRLCDRVIVTAGAVPAILQGLACAERGGTVLLFAPTDPDVTVPLDVNAFFWRSDRTITTTYAGTAGDHEEALELIRAGRVPVGEMITHRFSLDESQAAFRVVAEGRDSIKVLIRP
jgi:L-iditol 2-dehydrogenase